MLKEIMLVTAILDGDTIKAVDNDLVQHTIRMASIDAPELDQPYGSKSTETLKKVIGYQKVLLNCPGKDRYKRWICTISYDGKDINLYMVEQGAAWVYRRYYSGEAYIAVETKARQEGRGLWASEQEPFAPWIWRRNQYH